MNHHLLTILTILLLSSCSLIEDNPAVCPTDTADTFTMSFHMMTPVAAPDSRADSQHQEVNSEYLNFEDGIDVSDLTLFIFAKVVDNDPDTPENSSSAPPTSSPTHSSPSPALKATT